jgi:hypothetical protein
MCHVFFRAWIPWFAKSDFGMGQGMQPNILKETGALGLCECLT